MSRKEPAWRQQTAIFGAVDGGAADSAAGAGVADLGANGVRSARRLAAIELRLSSENTAPTNSFVWL